MAPERIMPEPPTVAPVPSPPARGRRTRLLQRFVLAAFVRLATGAQRLPRPAALRLGARLGALVGRGDKRRRRYARNNLRLAYGDALTPAERDALMRRCFEHWGRCTVEFLRGPSLDARRMAELVSAVEGREHLDAVRAAGGAFVIVTGHLGNFEFLGRWMAAQGVPSTVIARAPADPAFAAYLRGMREWGGNVALPKGTSVRELLAVLRRGDVLTLGVDQNSGDLFLPFFGVPAGTVAGPALLALRTGSPMLPAFCVFDPDGRYRVVFLPPIRPTSTGDKDADVARAMTEVNAALEGMVRRFPEQWLWLHHRWKSAFEEKNRARWPSGYDPEVARARWGDG